MEEIEYLEEYEDFILPNGANRTEHLAVGRSSVDSLEGLYKSLIGESPTPPGDTNVQYTAEPDTGGDKTSFSTMGVGVLGKAIQVTKSNADSGSTGHITKTNTSEIKHLYKSQPSNIFINRVTSKSFSTGPGLQRTDKLKSVATVKPTLQRTHNPVKQSISSNSPPFKNVTVVHSFHPYPHVTAAASADGSKVAFNASKMNVQTKSNIKTPNPYQGSGVDPLNLDDQDAFLDFDVDKHGSVDDFDFESDLDNSITAGISDMDSDSVDLTDDYSDGNFDLMESDLSSETSEVKKSVLLRRKKLQKSNSDANTNKFKVKPGATSNKLENKTDQMNLSKTKRPQQIKSDTNHQYFTPKTIEPDKRSIHSSFGERKIHETARKPQIIGTKDCSIKPLTTPTTTTTNKEGLFTNKLSMLSKLLNNPNDFLEKMPSAITTPKPTTAKKIIVVKKDEWSKSQSSKPSTATAKPNNTDVKREISKTHAETVKTKDDSLNAKSIESPSGDAITKLAPEPKLNKSLSSPPLNTEPSSPKVVETPDKNARIKFGSLYLKSIKPPANKALMANKILNMPTPPAHKKVENGQIKEKIISQKLSHEKKAPKAPTEEENKSLHDPIPDVANVSKKDFSPKKSLSTVDEDRSIHKSKAIEYADSNKPKRNSLKQNNHSNSLRKQLSGRLVEKHATPNQSNVNETNQVVQSTKCLTENGLNSATKESNSLKESITKPREIKAKSKENVGVKEKISTLQCTFKPRTFDIRLNKNAVARFFQSSTGCNKSNEPSTVKATEHASENALKRKITSSFNVNTSSANVVPERGQDKTSKSQEDLLPETQEICKKSRLSSDMPSKTSEKRMEIQTKNTKITEKNSCLKSRKKKRIHIKILVPPKNLRSRLKSLPRTSDTLNCDTSSESPVKKSTVEEKEGNVNKSPTISTEVISQNESSVADNANNIQVKRRVGRPRKLGKKKRTLTDVSPVSASALPVLTTPTKENSCNGEKEPTPIPPAATVVTDECMSSEDIVPASSQLTNLNVNPEVEMIQPKEELYGDTVIIQYQPDTSNMSTLADSIRNYGKKNTLNTQLSSSPHEANRRSNQLLLDTCTNTVNAAANTNDCRNETEVTVFELPSYIVMKTKLITRKELNSNKAYIPPLVKQKIDKLAEEREALPVIKTERPDFKDVCLEINALLDRNANYLKFASGSERQTRMNQVLADSSLTVDDAQCALKFLQSYLSLRTKDITLRSKNQQFIPIYDSQKKIIGYRKRRINPRKCKSSDGIRRSLPNTSSAASTVPVIPRSNISNLSSLPGTPSVGETLTFTTKKEPQGLDAGDGEIIVPDAPPSTEQCIKNEVENPREST